MRRPPQCTPATAVYAGRRQKRAYTLFNASREGDTPGENDYDRTVGDRAARIDTSEPNCAQLVATDKSIYF
jgi:hypothetical protein